MSAELIALDHYRARLRLALAAATAARRLWAQVDAGRLAASWRLLLPRLLVVLAGAQQAAAQAADGYVDEVLGEQGVDADAAGRVDPAALAGIASDGRALDSLLMSPAFGVLIAVGAGASQSRALAGGLASLDMIVRTQVADAGRAADQVALVARPQATGYVRMMVGRTCSRCAILAGRRYRWNAGFNRHPRCDCIHIPAREDSADDLRTDPKAYFNSLNAAEQDRIFTKAGAEAIRLGADPAQVVNARRGAAGLSPAGARITAEEARLLREGRATGRLEPRRVFGQDLFVTTEGTTTRGVAGRRLGAREEGVKTDGSRYRVARAPRLMPESILQVAAGNRDEAIRLLRRNGYLR